MAAQINEVSSDAKPTLGALADPTETAAWANVSGIAQAALSFWTTFLELQNGGVDVDVADPVFARLMCLIRAVSWVESLHGQGTGSSAAIDPMQCGNSADVWWTELTHSTVRPQDRFVRGPNLTPNYYAYELPAVTAANNAFPANAYISSLNDPTQGHSDAKYNQTISYFWAVPILIHKTNTSAKRPTYRCDGLDRTQMVAGAVAYNGGGDSAYEAKINAALDLIGCAPASFDEFDQPRLDPQTIVNDCLLEWPANKGDCNHFVKAVSTDLGVQLFGVGDDADAIVQTLRDQTTNSSATGWFKLIDGTDAKAKADAGQYVIAGLKGADHNPPRAHGHVAIVVTGPLAFQKYPTGFWGSSGGAAGANQTLNFAWNSDDVDQVEYFASALTQLATHLSESASESSMAIARSTVPLVLADMARQLDNQKIAGLFPRGVGEIEVTVQQGSSSISVKIISE
jgi:hypothetical protein